MKKIKCKGVGDNDGFFEATAPCAQRETPGYIIGIDLAQKGADYSVVKCQVCKTFQKLVSEDYFCKTCAKQKQENILLGR